MRRLRLRALVLAAGLGTRLRPLTDQVPKPLLPVCGLPAAGYALAALAAAGCEAVALNLHHLGERIRQSFGEEFAGMPLVYSEEPALLGTLGALAPLASFLGEADLVLLINGDSLCNWPLRRLVRRHQASGARATLLLASRPDPKSFGGGVAVDRRARILSFRPDSGGPTEHRRYVFAGAHVLSRDLLARAEERPASIVEELYEPLLGEQAHLQALVTHRRWHDLGMPSRYLDGAIDWARGAWPRHPWRRSWVSPQAVVESGARLLGSVIEPGARVETGARVEHSLLLPGARAGQGAVLRSVVVGFGATLPPGAWVERRLVTCLTATSRPGPHDTVVGASIYTPLDPVPLAGGSRRPVVGRRE